MSLNITVNNVEKLKDKDRKAIKDQFKEYLEDIKNYLKKYKEFPLQEKALEKLEAVNTKKSNWALSIIPHNKILIKMSGDKDKRNNIKMNFETTLEKLKNNDDYILDEFNVIYGYTGTKKIFVVRKNNKIYTAFSGGYNTSISELFSKIFHKNKSLDDALLKEKYYFLTGAEEAKGKEFLLLLDYFLDKKKEKPNKEIYLDLADYAENYLEKYNKYTKYDDFIKNIPNFFYVNNGYLIYKLKDYLNIQEIDEDLFSPTISGIKDKYDIYKITDKNYKEIIINDKRYKIYC